MPTELSIVNQVLSQIGRNPVTNVIDSNDAFVISQRLIVLLPELLRKTDWNFAIKQFYSNTPNTIPSFPDFAYNYTLPGDFGSFDRWSWTTTPQFGFYYRFIDNILCTNAKPVSLYYVINNIDYAVIQPSFEQALIFYVASQVCLVLTNNPTLTKWLSDEYDKMLPNAILQNDMQRYVQSTPFNDFDRQSYI